MEENNEDVEPVVSSHNVFNNDFSVGFDSHKSNRWNYCESITTKFEHWKGQ